MRHEVLPVVYATLALLALAGCSPDVEDASRSAGADDPGRGRLTKALPLDPVPPDVELVRVSDSGEVEPIQLGVLMNGEWEHAGRLTPIGPGEDDPPWPPATTTSWGSAGRIGFLLRSAPLPSNWTLSAFPGAGEGVPDGPKVLEIECDFQAIRSEGGPCSSEQSDEGWVFRLPALESTGPGSYRLALQVVWASPTLARLNRDANAWGTWLFRIAADSDE